jgi:hypothetical protein
MKPLKEVEAAKALFTEAIDWSVMKWLGEKKRVRKAADMANDALDKLSVETRESWPEHLRTAYEELSAKPGHREHKGNGTTIAQDAKQFASQVHEADLAAHHTRMEAEDIFDRAERRLSTSMAREGCKKAIEGWILHEKAIRMAENAPHTKKSIA